MKKITIFCMLAATMLLFAQCKNEKKGGLNDDEAQVENLDEEDVDDEDFDEADFDDEFAEGDEESGEYELKLPLKFSGEKPTVKDVVIALPQMFSPEILGEEAMFENPHAIYEAMAHVVKTGENFDGSELKIDEKKGIAWYKETTEQYSSVLAVKLDGNKVTVDLKSFYNDEWIRGQFDGLTTYRVDAANKVLKDDYFEPESITDEEGNLK